MWEALSSIFKAFAALGDLFKWRESGKKDDEAKAKDAAGKLPDPSRPKE